jgi:hypothetical protein
MGNVAVSTNPWRLSASSPDENHLRKFRVELTTDQTARNKGCCKIETDAGVVS